MDIKTVSHMLGHTDAGFTMNTYMHVTDSMQENVANKISLRKKEWDFLLHIEFWNSFQKKKKPA